MFKVLIVVCSIMPFPRGEILQTDCFYVVDQWQPSIHGYKTRKQCERRLNTIISSIKKKFSLVYIKQQKCIESQDKRRI